VGGAVWAGLAGWEGGNDDFAARLAQLSVVQASVRAETSSICRCIVAAQLSPLADMWQAASIYLQ
jgi:hypothetical protein